MTQQISNCRFQAKLIKKLAQLHEKSIDERKLLNTKKENNKLEDLIYSKNYILPEPFSKVKETQNFLSLHIDETERNKRMCVEIWYARLTSITQKETAAVFHLNRNERNLSAQEHEDNLIKYIDD